MSAEETPSEPVTTVCCQACHEWYDARASACYFCGTERAGQNIHLIKAAHETALHTSLSRQAGFAQAEARVSAQIPSGNLGGKTGPSQLYAVPGARNLAASIKQSLFGE